MEDKEILKAVLEEILQFKIARVELATMQKTIEIDDVSKGIRLDVYAADDEKNIIFHQICEANLVMTSKVEFMLNEQQLAAW